MSSTTTITLDERKTEFTHIPLISATNTIFKLNGGQTGFYRVAYSNEILEMLGEAIASNRLSITDRLGILNDAFYLAFAFQSNIVSALNLLEKFSKEKDYNVWLEISGQLGKFSYYFFEHSESIHEDVSSFSRKLFFPIVQKLGWEFYEFELVNDIKLRTLAISICGHSGEKTVLKEARRRFNLFYHKKDSSALHPNIRRAVFSMLVRFGNEDDYKRVYDIYDKSVDASNTKAYALSALSSSRSPDLIKRALEMSLDRNIIKPQDINYIFYSIVGNEFARRQTWAFVKMHWKLLYDEFYKSAPSILSSLILSVAGSLTKDKDAIDLENFFKNQGYDVCDISHTIKQSIERSKIRANWIKKESTSVEAWFAHPKQKLIKLNYPLINIFS